MVNNCPSCHKEPAIVHATYGVLKGKKCRDVDRKKVSAITPPPEFPTLSMNDRITTDRLKHEKDILQPWGNNWQPNPDFVKAYPELARDYFTQEQLEKL